MKRKLIIFGVALVFFSLLVIPTISAMNEQVTNSKNKEILDTYNDIYSNNSGGIWLVRLVYFLLGMRGYDLGMPILGLLIAIFPWLVP